MLKVLIKRIVPAGKEKEVAGLITQMRAMAAHQPGYISGETLRSAENPDQVLVISIWNSEDDWKVWQASEQRKAVQAKIDAVAGTETVYETYYYPHMPHAD